MDTGIESAKKWLHDLNKMDTKGPEIHRSLCKTIGIEADGMLSLPNLEHMTAGVALRRMLEEAAGESWKHADGEGQRIFVAPADFQYAFSLVPAMAYDASCIRGNIAWKMLGQNGVENNKLLEVCRFGYAADAREGAAAFADCSLENPFCN